MFGVGSRGMISLPVRSAKTSPIWVHFIIDPGAPVTFLSVSTSKALKVDETKDEFEVYINSHRCSAKQSKKLFDEVNILGMDYLLNRKKLRYDLFEMNVEL